MLEGFRNRNENFLFGLTVVAAVLVRFGVLMALPPEQAPDEAAHAYYVTYLVEHGRLPVLPERSIDMWQDPRHQAYQPPLAYLSMVPALLLSEAAGLGDAGQLRALRALNVLYGLGLVVVGYLVVCRLTGPGDPRRLMVAVLIALVPGFVGISSVVNNDALANLLVGLLWLVLLSDLPDRRRAMLAGVTLGAACLAKLTGIVAAALVPVVPLLLGRTRFRDVVWPTALAGLVAGSLMTPWLFFNWWTYGSPLPIGAGSLSFEWLATVLPAELVVAQSAPDPGKAFLQFWGRFGVYNNLRWVVIPWLLVPAAALAGLGWLRQQRGEGRDPLTSLAPALVLAIVLTALALASFSLRYYGGWQGRYLYPATIPVALLLAGGWARLFSPHGLLKLGGLIGVVLFVVDAALIFKLYEFYVTHPPASWGLAISL